MPSAILQKKQRDELLRVLKARFEKNLNRHQCLEWARVQAKMEANAEKLWSLNEMERTGGEPDVVGHDKKTGEYIFYDCAAESPKGRRSLCYDSEALEKRKENKPRNNAMDMAAAMAIDLLTEEEYRELQKLEISIPKPQAGSKRLPRSENSAAPCFAIAASTLFSCITTARKVTMRRGGSAAH